MTTHPSWCDGEHPSGAPHRGVVGRTTVGGAHVSVVVTQASSGMPSVMLSGPVVMEVNDLDHADMATLLDLAGQPALAVLIRRASQILKAAPAEVA